MSYREYTEWVLYFKELEDMRKREEEKSKGNLLAMNESDFIKGMTNG